MKRVLKWIGIVLVVVIAIAAIAIISIMLISNNRLNRTYEVGADFSIEVPVDDQERIAAGERLFNLYCAGCHTESASGEIFSDDFMFGRMYTANLTSGENGITARYTDEEIARVIWYGVRPDGSVTIGMPYELNRAINTVDMENIIAYIRTLPPVDTDYPEPQPGPMMAVMHVTGLFPVVPAELVDLNAAPPVPVAEDDVLALGEYMTVFCTACHGPDFTGLDLFGSPNITPDETAIGTWTEEEFIRAITQGERPDGTQIDPEMMPWQDFQVYTEEELHAIWEYLQTVAPVPVQ